MAKRTATRERRVASSVSNREQASRAPARVQGEQFAAAVDPIRQIVEKSLVRQIERPRMFPVVLNDFTESVDDLVVAHLDRELPATIQTSGGQIHRADHRGDAISKQHLAVEPEVSDLVNLCAHIVEDPQAADAFDQLFSFERVWRTRHDVDFDAPLNRADEPFDDHRILKSFVLEEQAMPRVVDELA